ncbi:MAG: DUF3576 domain-containing protein [Rhodospirillales bacterium]|nr:DUF3576 domain-containing protein [Rhodospirillales bacterium]
MGNVIGKCSRRRTCFLAVSLAFFLGACEGATNFEDENVRIENDEVVTGPRETITGRDGLDFFGGDEEKKAAPGGGIGVNAFLWRASLDTVAIWPVNSADPFGGVILTDWYAPPETPDERIKLNVYILDRALRADGIRVSVFRQVRGRAGGWRDAEVHKSTATKLENAILMRARQFRYEIRQ